MPELPEVETIRIGIAPHILGETVQSLIVRNRKLRWPVSRRLDRELPGQQIRKVERRAKYILVHGETGCLILHLGMSGSLRILTEPVTPGKHDHIDIVFDSGQRLRFTDPRRFGSLHWTRKEPLQHPLLQHLGPEPLSDELDGDYLFSLSRKRTQSVKSFIMDGRIVVGVGNIYANESLFAAGIHPGRRAGRISQARYEQLADEIKSVLTLALQKGGTTLRDFIDGEGRPGYFRHELKVYDRTDQPCPVCNNPIRQQRIGQRSSFYCPHCQH
ncbi:MAG: bifunctional DNA-formamidopyrimidine glycosylase/DNA-(apurinic or apyrimidinic site) lyase [Gammaproteobacteria bacterium]|nr:bifunctional DNA-formamidopyrimidine glycosylase/DNA-(apurinic or apyrimidinic site) lyase [Gammaproteobacteria bacterium]